VITLHRQWLTLAGISVGTAAAAVGLLTSTPLIIATGVAAAANPLVQVYRYFDDRQSAELSDTYFLWKAARRAAH
jgi:hypothetical protein